MRNRAHFQGRWGGGTTFRCTCCGRSTRLVDQDNEDYCRECYELAGIQNSIWDDGIEQLPHLLPEVNRLFAIIVKRGGDEAKVRAAFPDLFPNKEG